MSAYVELQEAEFAAAEGVYCCETPEVGVSYLMQLLRLLKRLLLVHSKAQQRMNSFKLCYLLVQRDCLPLI